MTIIVMLKFTQSLRANMCVYVCVGKAIACLITDYYHTSLDAISPLDFTHSYITK